MAKRKKNFKDYKVIEIVAQKHEQFPPELLKRAKEAGVSDEQVKSIGTTENLKAFCDRISPDTNPDAQPKRGEIKKVAQREPEKLPEILPLHKDNFSDEKSIIESVVRKLNIKFNSPKIKTVIKTVVYDCEKRQVVSGEYKIEKGQ